MKEKHKAPIAFQLGIILGAIIVFSTYQCTHDYGVEDAKSDVKIFNKTYGTEYSYQEWLFYEYDIKQMHNRFNK